jgi:hypothetical protein
VSEKSTIINSTSCSKSLDFQHFSILYYWPWMTVDDREINQSIVMDGWKFVWQVYKEASEEYGHVSDNSIKRSMKVVSFYKEALEGCVHLSDKSIKRLLKSMAMCLTILYRDSWMMSLSVNQIYKEALEECVYLSDKSIKRAVKDMFICQTNL